MKKIILKSSAYLLAFLVSIFLFYISYYFIEDKVLSSWLINISSAFIFIPLGFFVFEKINKFTNKKLTKEIFDYVKKDIDNDIMSIVSDLIKFLGFDVFSTGSFSVFLKMSSKQLEERLKEHDPLGFRIFKKWSKSEEYFNEALKNSVALKSFDNEQIIILIKIIKEIISWERIIHDQKNWRELKKDNKFKITKGTDLNVENNLFPERYLLLKKYNEKFIVKDFGDFSSNNSKHLNKRFVLKKSAVPKVLDSMKRIQGFINDWINNTGDELILDTRKFKTIKPIIKNN